MNSRSLLGIAFLVLLFPVKAAHATCERNEYGVFEDVACAVNALANADRRLNETYKQVLARLDANEKAKLKTAQRAWVQYRDAHVQFLYAVEGDGSFGRRVVANDGERQLEARIKELSSWLPGHK